MLDPYLPNGHLLAHGYHLVVAPPFALLRHSHTILFSKMATLDTPYRESRRDASHDEFFVARQISFSVLSSVVLRAYQ